MKQFRRKPGWLLEGTGAENQPAGAKKRNRIKTDRMKVSSGEDLQCDVRCHLHLAADES